MEPAAGEGSHDPVLSYGLGTLSRSKRQLEQQKLQRTAGKDVKWFEEQRTDTVILSLELIVHHDFHMETGFPISM
jgi:hypothetical protein